MTDTTLLMIAAPLGALVLCPREDPARFRRVLILAAILAGLTMGYMLVMRALIGTATISYRAPMAGDWSDYFRRGGIDTVLPGLVTRCISASALRASGMKLKASIDNDRSNVDASKRRRSASPTSKLVNALL